MTDIVSINIAAWLACLTFTLMLVNGGFKLARNVKGEEPTPPNANLGQSIGELNRRVTGLEQWREGLIRKLDSDKMELLDAGEERARRLHQRIDDMPAQMIAILKNTGAIGK